MNAFREIIRQLSRLCSSVLSEFPELYSFIARPDGYDDISVTVVSDCIDAFSFTNGQRTDVGSADVKKLERG